MSKLLKYRESVTPAEAAKYLTEAWGEVVTEDAVHRLIHDGHLRMAIALNRVNGLLEGVPRGRTGAGWHVSLDGAFRVAKGRKKSARGGRRVELGDGAVAECGGVDVEAALKTPLILTADLLAFAVQANDDTPEKPLHPSERRSIHQIITVLAAIAEVDLSSPYAAEVTLRHAAAQLKQEFPGSPETVVKFLEAPAKKGARRRS